MRFEAIQLENKNNLNRDYRLQQENIKPFFEYNPYHDFEKRLGDIYQQDYNREGLTNILRKMNLSWDAPIATIKQIDRLNHPNSVVVIGGQQAGLLTGPNYSINKIISIIKLARDQEDTLGIPVIPVFWIAGEDHDFAEINHTFSIKDGKMYKHSVRHMQTVKKAISNMPVDKQEIKRWLRQFLNDQMETAYSKQWFNMVVQSLTRSTTYVDFFARLIYQLFPEQGLVLVDSHYPNLRQLESGQFVRMIERQKELNDAVYQSIESLRQLGYPVPLDMDKEDVNLFYHGEDMERILLKREQNIWIGKQNEVRLTTEEMLDLAKIHPERLSNNVITRPMMQESLFPTLAFIGGDGEISYWAALKKAFTVLELKMPPVVPRLSLSLVTERIQKLLDLRLLHAKNVINQGLEHSKLNWLQSQRTVPTDTMFQEAKKSIARIHAPLEHAANDLGTDLSQIAKQNLIYMQRQLDYLQKKMDGRLTEQYQTVIHQFDEIQYALYPNQGLQERIWNPFSFINDYGFNFLESIIDSELSFKTDHYIMYLEK